MYLESGRAWVSSRDSIMLGDFPESIRHGLTRWIERRYKQTNAMPGLIQWTWVYFLLDAEPENSEYFPVGKAVTLETLFALLQDVVSTLSAKEKTASRAMNA